MLMINSSRAIEYNKNTSKFTADELNQARAHLEEVSENSNSLYLNSPQEKSSGSNTLGTVFPKRLTTEKAEAFMN